MKGYSEGRLTVLLTKKALRIKVFDELVADTPAKALVLLDGNAWDFYNRIAFRKSGRGSSEDLSGGGRMRHMWRRIEVVITGRTRNALAGVTGSRVRIPPSPPNFRS